MFILNFGGPLRHLCLFEDVTEELLSLGTGLRVKWKYEYSKNRPLNNSFPKNSAYQAIHGNDQNASATNQKTGGSKLDRAS